MNKDRLLASPRQFTRVLGAGFQTVDKSLERVSGLRVSGQNLVVRTAIEATRRAPDAGAATMRRVLRQNGLVPRKIETRDTFRDRLETFEDGVGLLAQEIETDTDFGVSLGRKWIDIAKTQKPETMPEPKTDVDYVCDYAYVLQHAEVSEVGIQRVVMGLHTHFLDNGGNMNVAEGDEPTLGK